MSEEVETITFSRTPCFGACPQLFRTTYAFEPLENGTVRQRLLEMTQLTFFAVAPQPAEPASPEAPTAAAAVS